MRHVQWIGAYSRDEFTIISGHYSCDSCTTQELRAREAQELATRQFNQGCLKVFLIALLIWVGILIPPVGIIALIVLRIRWLNQNSQKKRPAPSPSQARAAGLSPQQTKVATRPWSQWAIWSFISSVAGWIIFIGPFLGIAFGYVGLNEMKRSGMSRDTGWPSLASRSAIPGWAWWC